MNSSLSGNGKGRRGYNSSDCPVVHRTVRWANGRLRQRSTTQSSRNTWTAPTVSWCIGLFVVHRTVSGAPISPEEQRSDMPNLEGDHAPDSLHDLSGGTPDCPVRHSTEGKDSLPCWSPTAPSCLGAIKGTPRRMEENTKHTLSILRLLDFAFTQSDHRSWDLSTIRVVNSSRCVCVLTFSLVCVVVLWIWFLCVLLSPTLLCAFFVISIVRVRDSKLWRFLANRKDTKGKDRGIQVDLWIAWKGLSATLVHWDATTWK
jgi:hypothetical protein